MIYDKIQQPWKCVCDRILYTQADDLCMDNALATSLNAKYSESNAVNINFRQEVEVI